MWVGFPDRDARVCLTQFIQSFVSFILPLTYLTSTSEKLPSLGAPPVPPVVTVWPMASHRKTVMPRRS
jgi:hypothetical protein